MKNSKELFEDEHFEHNINTGYIHTDMCNNWSNYSRELFEEVEWKLESILWHKRKITVPYDEKFKNYLEEKRKMYEGYLEYRKIQENPTVVFNAGLHHKSISLQREYYEKVAHPIIGDYSIQK